jgi:1-aminocyclopropane-1-carboxylate deaminase/D-cysteine desulfhydrase-like pyridoxal-dependent ACC family enzyme
MMAGLATKARQGQVLMGFPALKVNAADPLYHFVLTTPTAASITFSYDYHWGGYAKTSPVLPAFMNQLFQEFGLPTDQVYTAKLFFGVLDLIRKDYFPKHSRILIIHSGGLQGNRSLPENTLVF